MRTSLTPTISSSQIQEMVTHLAQEVEQDYSEQRIVFIVMLKGSFMFFSDLVRQIKLPQVWDFVAVQSKPDGGAYIKKDIHVNLTNENVIIVTTVMDAGRSIQFLKSRIALAYPKTLKVLSLLDKPSRRELPISPDYCGQVVDDRFIVGYGLDINEKGRQYKEFYNFTQ